MTLEVSWVPLSHQYPRAIAQAATEAKFREYHPQHKEL